MAPRRWAKYSLSLAYLEAFSRGREAEGHVALERLPDRTVRGRDADCKLKGENWVTHSLR